MIKTLRRITGKYMATPTEALRLECGLPSLGTQINRLVMKAAEKAARLPEEHPRKIAYEKKQPPRLKKSSWRAKTNELRFFIPNMDDRAPMEYFEYPPWTDAPCLEIYTSLEGVKSRMDDLQIRKEASIRRIEAVNADLTIYTDGSASGGTRMGGAGVVITDGRADDPHVLESIMKKGAIFTCSYEEEVNAMLIAAEWISHNCGGSERILICTDSQSLCMALESYNPETEGIRNLLRNHKKTIIVQWIPGHAGVPGNDLADGVAKGMLDQPRPISYRSACMVINSTFQDIISHKRIAETYQKYNAETEKEIQTKKDQVQLARTIP